MWDLWCLKPFSYLDFGHLLDIVWCSTTIIFTSFRIFFSRFHLNFLQTAQHWKNSTIYKVCSEKKFTRISMYYENFVRFCGKSLRSAKSRHPKVSKMVRQVYISQKMPSVDMILCFKKISANTIFVKKRVSNFVSLCFSNSRVFEIGRNFLCSPRSKFSKCSLN